MEKSKISENKKNCYQKEIYEKRNILKKETFEKERKKDRKKGFYFSDISKKSL